MVIGLGVDVFEVSRMERALREGDPGFAPELFTPDEIAYCRRQPNPSPHFAERFALKEAVFKALSITSEPGASWREVELRRADGSAVIVLHGRVEALARERGVRRVLHSLTRVQGLAIARAILESEDA